MFNLGAFEIIVLCFLGLLIFGRRLPEVGRNLGKSIIEFKKGLSGVDEDANRAAQAPRPLNQVNSHDSARIEDRSVNHVSTDVGTSTTTQSNSSQTT